MTNYRFSLLSAKLGIAGLALLMAVVTLLVSHLGIRGIAARIQGADLIVEVAIETEPPAQIGSRAGRGQPEVERSPLGRPRLLLSVERSRIISQ